MAEPRLKVNAVESEDDLCLYRIESRFFRTARKVDEEKTGFVPAMTFNLSRNTRHVQFSTEYLYLPEDFEPALPKAAKCCGVGLPF